LWSLPGDEDEPAAAADDVESCEAARLAARLAFRASDAFIPVVSTSVASVAALGDAAAAAGVAAREAVRVAVGVAVRVSAVGMAAAADGDGSCRTTDFCGRPWLSLPARVKHGSFLNAALASAAVVNTACAEATLLPLATVGPCASRLLPPQRVTCVCESRQLYIADRTSAHTHKMLVPVSAWLGRAGTSVARQARIR
jgi:hypothetical protein